ncbi:hypothetical protein MGG_17354 [Pyricularia oryzae 70-15]|uniref:Uncharacterized protein n=1 Tax=Pyricularia oryzae (strain 70-15 / ATCC MYA-4617 / FGSC 8958) TaxID=242507 RepID=G4NDS7_PYRO7|nr:uncharacterized protein MGG_17354 [Pyricularia oryzae 70-15]EHA48515.1 hypothetical protein MGG_17354 [Pyricularia oryzae 70-15]
MKSNLDWRKSPRICRVKADFEPNQDEELDEIDLAGMLIAATAKHMKSSRRPRNNNRRPSR